MKWLFIISAIIAGSSVFAQDSAESKTGKWEINGYIKNMQSLYFDKNFNNSVSGNLLHNRINIKWKPSEKITTVAEVRSRLFWGEEVKLTPEFASQLRNENEIVNLQQTWINKTSLVLLSNVERLYIDYQERNWNLRIGRQRINWGETITWNPNDIFNTYNFLDFDYEERPGVDGGKFKYLLNNFSNIELACATNGNKDGSVAAIKYALNKWGYDMQIITGWYHNQPTIGAGWAGNIKEAGFKGEVQYFIPARDSLPHLNVTLESDYMFKKGWYVNFGLLYTNQGFYKPVDNWEDIHLQFSPKNLMPTKWNIMLTTSKQFTPLFTGSMSTVYAPGTNLLIIFPTFQYNIATNLDITLVWQSFFSRYQNRFQAGNHSVFLRMKWSF
ncbi:MAG: hypothetical protein KGM16_16505 [Bacteroidota bacterium]|nr:hypothetical protein [Bacteroidota bacterium]